MPSKEVPSQRLTASQTAKKLAKIAMQVLAPMSDDEQEKRISLAENRVATKNFIRFR